jgi:predicted TIM-barrel fold metal-dependent hydrolase
MGKYVIVSSDCHAGPPAEQYREYMDPGFRERYDEFLAGLARFDDARAAHVNNAQRTFREKFLSRTGDGGNRASWDPALREQEMDREGIAAEVVFPDADVLGIGGVTSTPFGTGLAASGRDDAALAMAGARAHNRWLADLCAADPVRRGGIATVPIVHDVAAAVAEIERAHDAGVRAGVMIPTQWAPHPSYNDPVYDPVWAVCQERGLAVTVHSGGSPRDVTVGPGALPIYASEAWFFAARPLWSLIWGGVFERFPGLTFAVTEDGAWWVPDMLARMDEQWHGFHATLKFGTTYREALPEPPSAYYRRHCFVGAGMNPHEIARRHEIGVDQIAWGNDFPHPEGTWPHTRDWLRIKFHDCTEDETRRMLGLNALRCYRSFDAAALEAIAERIGPSPAEIHDQPVPPSPDLADA